MIEVRHNDFETLILFTDEVLDRDFDIFEGDISSTRAMDTLAVHFSGGDAFTAFDQENGDAAHAFAARADCNGEVIGPDTVCQIH